MKQKPHELFKRDGNDLLCTFTVTYEEALKGPTLIMKFLDDKTFTIKIPPLSNSNYVHIIR